MTKFDEVEYKECRNCKVYRHRDNYNKKSLSNDGLQYWCIPCLNIRRKNGNRSHYKLRKKENRLNILIDAIFYHERYKLKS